jgi:hypothetical protein
MQFPWSKRNLVPVIRSITARWMCHIPVAASAHKVAIKILSAIRQLISMVTIVTSLPGFAVSFQIEKPISIKSFLWVSSRALSCL